MRKITLLLSTALIAAIAVSAQQSTPSNSPAPQVQQPSPALPPKAPAGCIAGPVKKPRIHIPKKIQDAINKNVDKVASKTGVEVDKNAPAQAVKDAQNKPCV